MAAGSSSGEESAAGTSPAPAQEEIQEQATPSMMAMMALLVEKVGGIQEAVDQVNARTTALEGALADVSLSDSGGPPNGSGSMSATPMGAASAERLWVGQPKGLDVQRLRRGDEERKPLREESLQHRHRRRPCCSSILAGETGGILTPQITPVSEDKHFAVPYLPPERFAIHSTWVLHRIPDQCWDALARWRAGPPRGGVRMCSRDASRHARERLASSCVGRTDTHGRRAAFLARPERLPPPAEHPVPSRACGLQSGRRPPHFALRSCCGRQRRRR